VKKLT